MSAGRVGEQARDLGEVIDVWLFALALAPVVGVSPSGELPVKFP
jgi:hypothetical protein